MKPSEEKALLLSAEKGDLLCTALRAQHQNGGTKMQMRTQSSATSATNQESASDYDLWQTSLDRRATAAADAQISNRFSRPWHLAHREAWGQYEQLDIMKGVAPGPPDVPSIIGNATKSTTGVGVPKIPDTVGGPSSGRSRIAKGLGINAQADDDDESSSRIDR
jgi:hypothetical protein